MEQDPNQLHQPEEFGPQPDFPALAHHMDAAMQQFIRIPNMPMFGQGAVVTQLLLNIREDLRQLYEHNEKTQTAVHRMEQDIKDIKVDVHKLQVDSRELRQDVNRIKDDIQHIRAE